MDAEAPPTSLTSPIMEELPTHAMTAFATLIEFGDEDPCKWMVWPTECLVLDLLLRYYSWDPGCDVARAIISIWAPSSLRTVIIQIPVLPRQNRIAAGGRHTVMITSRGSLRSWGDDRDGQCAGTPGGTDYVSVAA
eukprot:gene4155-4477_t